MKLNCKQIILKSFRLEDQVHTRYANSIKKYLHEHSPQLTNDSLVLLESADDDYESFCERVLSDKLSTPCMSLDMGICLAKSGMLECADLNAKSGIRAAVVHNEYIADMCRKHNDTNVCVVGTDCLGEQLAAELVGVFLKSGFDSEERNMIRVNKMKEFDHSI